MKIILVLTCKERNRYNLKKKKWFGRENGSFEMKIREKVETEYVVVVVVSFFFF